jgi:hypothetical protein
MKKKYDTERGTHIIIIKRIIDAGTKMGTKIMAYKMQRKFCKEDVTIGVVAVAAQCA